MIRSVRPWTESDFPAVRAVLQRSWEAAYGSFIPTDDLRGYLDENYSVDELRRIAHDPEVTGFVGLRDSDVVAVMRLRDHRAEDRTYVSSIYVVPEEQRTGWGRRLMSVAARLAAAAGRHELWLGVMTQNVPALAWYRRHGFIAEREEPFRMRGTAVLHLIGHLPVDHFLGPAASSYGDQR
ncbi:MAG: GNAT family N-acetyltransferase [Bacteroidetes bacterium]|jgi:ribosomal protein S18 acetylase RimI-like enzyme|nr:GNAT family N-acetyltransferase [Bacteroidota bacterium]